MAINQAYLFLIFAFNGVVVGLIFDFFRILRKTFTTSNVITYIEDVLFWILTGISIIFFMYNFSDGTIRLFMIIALLLGFLFYILSISKFIIKIFVFSINIMKDFFKTIINIGAIPAKLIYKVIYNIIIKHIKYLILKIQQIFYKKIKNLHKG